MRRVLAVAALAAFACIPEEGPMMEPGEDCLECHGGAGGGDDDEDAVAWTVAGTYGHEGSKISIRDATGWSFTLTANRAGNFYTREPVRFPLNVAVDGEPMDDPITYGGCNANRCHPGGGEGGD